ncbi:MAG: hypothetical protein LBR70_06390 [Lactobacillaceae bacterium]|jgi:hypothetical protein|nr:hypothetical protein [Lactobacillaceae bacterium]
MIWWGVKTEAAFDVWSIEHLIMGITVGWIADKIISKRILGDEKVSEKTRNRINVVIVLMIAYMWETLEHYIETGLFGGPVRYWFQGVEHWTNRLIFDNIMVVLGWTIYVKRGGFVWFARVFSIVWLTVHIFMFPHSMYLHTMFENNDNNEINAIEVLETEKD